MICIPIASGTMKEALHAIERSCLVADFIELRMDLIGKRNLAKLISAARQKSGSIKIIVTCRRKEEAAPVAASTRIKDAVKNRKEKMALLKEAIELKADFIDIELAEGRAVIQELQSFCSKNGEKTKIIVSYHNLKETPALIRLQEIFRKCKRYKPDVIKIVTTAKNREDNLTALNLIPYARKYSQKIISLCMGDKGGISRATAPLMGGYLSFATLTRKGQSAPGQFTVHEMQQFNKLFNDRLTHPLKPVFSLHTPLPQNYILLGNPVGHSLSPLMHSAALKKMGIEENYSALCVQDLGDAVQGMRAMNIRGASVTIPFKVAVMEYLDDIEDDALEIGAVNTIINHKGQLRGCNTDWRGLMMTLKKAMSIKDKAFVIIGAGGTARAAAYGIMKEGGFPVIANRTLEKGRTLAGQLNCPFYALSEVGRMKAQCLINTTSVGMYPYDDKSPVKINALSGYKYVMDVIYNPLKTKLLKDAEKQGCRILSGADMFVHQGAEQLRLWTGKEPPRPLMKKVILERLSKIE